MFTRVTRRHASRLRGSVVWQHRLLSFGFLGCLTWIGHVATCHLFSPSTALPPSRLPPKIRRSLGCISLVSVSRNCPLCRPRQHCKQLLITEVHLCKRSCHVGRVLHTKFGHPPLHCPSRHRKQLLVRLLDRCKYPCRVCETLHIGPSPLPSPLLQTASRPTGPALQTPMLCYRVQLQLQLFRPRRLGAARTSLP